MEIQLSGSILSLLSLFQGGAGLDEMVRHTVIIAEILNVIIIET